MPKEVLRYDPQLMAQAAATFGNARERVQDVTQEVLSIANTLEDALKGEAGSEFVDVLTSIMVRSLGDLTEKMNDIQKDIKDAMAEMAAKDKDVSGTF